MAAPLYWVDKDTKEKYRVNGFEKSTRLPEKANLRKQFSDVNEIKTEAELPKGGVDLRAEMPPIQNQGSIASW